VLSVDDGPMDRIAERLASHRRRADLEDPKVVAELLNDRDLDPGVRATLEHRLDMLKRREASAVAERSARAGRPLRELIEEIPR
jgi:hypothetical protein